MGTGSKAMATVGFFFAMIMSLVLYSGGAYYLFNFLWTTNEHITSIAAPATDDAGESESPPGYAQFYLARFAMSKLVFHSCGLFIGMGTGFLGAALCLAGIRGSMDVAASDEKRSINITNMAPGAFAIFCATVIVICCVVVRPPMLNYGQDWAQQPLWTGSGGWGSAIPAPDANPQPPPT